MKMSASYPAIRGKVGVSILPGSTSVWDRATGEVSPLSAPQERNPSSRRDDVPAPPRRRRCGACWTHSAQQTLRSSARGLLFARGRHNQAHDRRARTRRLAWSKAGTGQTQKLTGRQVDARCCLTRCGHAAFRSAGGAVHAAAVQGLGPRRAAQPRRNQRHAVGQPGGVPGPGQLGARHQRLLGAWLPRGACAPARLLLTPPFGSPQPGIAGCISCASSEEQPRASTCTPPPLHTPAEPRCARVRASGVARRRPTPCPPLCALTELCLHRSCACTRLPSPAGGLRPGHLCAR